MILNDSDNDERVKQTKTRTDKAVMTQNNSDNDERVIAGRNPD